MRTTRLPSLLVLLAAGLFPRLAGGAERPTIDTTFVAVSRPDIARLRAEGLSDPAAVPAWSAVRRLYGLREEQLTLLSGVHGLHTLTGVATQDAVDQEILRAMHEIAIASVHADSIAPTPEEATRMAEILGGIPTLGEKPFGFMVLGFAGLVVAAADSLEHTGTVSPAAAARMGLRLVSHATTLHIEAYKDPLGALGQNDNLTQAFLARLRCPQDGAAYSVSNLRTRLSGDQLFRLYDLVCPVEGTLMQVEFYQEMASRLYQMAPLQKTATGPEKRAGGGPNP